MQNTTSSLKSHVHQKPLFFSRCTSCYCLQYCVLVLYNNVCIHMVIIQKSNRCDSEAGSLDGKNIMIFSPL